jgi:3-oxoacyl-[acyl-carrier protein] reductase
MKLAGLNALITGGSQGLGRAIAETFVCEGASVMLCARDAALLENARAELAALAQSGQKVLARACDVSSEQQVNDLAAHAIAEFGAVHVLVNNAGV